MSFAVVENDITYNLHIYGNELHIDALYVPEGDNDEEECFMWTTVITNSVFFNKVKASVDKIYEIFRMRPSNIDIQFDTFKSCDDDLTIIINYNLENVLNDTACIILNPVKQEDGPSSLFEKVSLEMQFRYQEFGTFIMECEIRKHYKSGIVTSEMWSEFEEWFAEKYYGECPYNSSQLQEYFDLIYKKNEI